MIRAATGSIQSHPDFAKWVWPLVAEVRLLAIACGLAGASAAGVHYFVKRVLKLFYELPVDVRQDLDELTLFDYPDTGRGASVHAFVSAKLLPIARLYTWRPMPPDAAGARSYATLPAEERADIRSSFPTLTELEIDTTRWALLRIDDATSDGNFS